MEQKRGKTWQSMSISNDVFDKLDVVREKTEKTLGMKLSWTKFFGWMLQELDRAKPAAPPVPAPIKPIAKPVAR